jgi:hypothetical protein
MMIAVAALVLLGISCFFFLKAKPWEQQQESTERKIDGNHLTAKEAGR